MRLPKIKFIGTKEATDRIVCVRSAAITFEALLSDNSVVVNVLCGHRYFLAVVNGRVMPVIEDLDYHDFVGGFWYPDYWDHTCVNFDPVSVIDLISEEG